MTWQVINPAKNDFFVRQRSEAAGGQILTIDCGSWLQTVLARARKMSSQKFNATGSSSSRGPAFRRPTGMSALDVRLFELGR